MINKYSFGSITIDGKDYSKDVEVRWSVKDLSCLDQASDLQKVDDVLPWDIKEKHQIGLDDIQTALKQDPNVLVIGTGAYGEAKVRDDVFQELKNRGIKAIVDRTDPAVERFNLCLSQGNPSALGQTRVVGLFHLTC